MTDFKVFVDLDDVLVDFYGQCATKLFELDPDRVKEIIKESGKWAITEALGFSEESLWRFISSCGDGFWEDMRLLPWAEQMMTVLYEEFGRQNVYILTSHGHYKISKTTCGKMKWLDSNRLNLLPKNFIVTSEKHLFAARHRLLLDDRIENCIEFEKHGGCSALFPSPGNNVAGSNHLHKMEGRGTEFVLEFLHEQIEEFKRCT